MTPADLANTIAAAREAKCVCCFECDPDHERGCPMNAVYEAGFVTLRAAERYLALWQALEWRHMYLNGVLPPPFGHDCHWCGDCCGRFADAERQALAQAAEDA